MTIKKKNDHNEAFGRALRELRRSKGLSQEDLGFEARRDRTYISLLELGQRSPTLDTCIALCGALGVSLTELASRIEREMSDEA
ncbi:MAG: helix-turn-helix transcriptional regulator [Betaproteobacteria bacterium]|nr:helix-turn-helix transcriptional regulator [Betaproteobacteria bacterium]